MLAKIAALFFVAVLLVTKWGNLPHADTQVLQGTWEIVSVERAGANDPSPVGYTLTFTGAELHFQMPLDETPFQYLLREAKPLSDVQMQRMALS